MRNVFSVLPSFPTLLYNILEIQMFCRSRFSHFNLYFSGNIWNCYHPYSCKGFRSKKMCSFKRAYIPDLHFNKLLSR